MNNGMQTGRRAGACMGALTRMGLSMCLALLIVVPVWAQDLYIEITKSASTAMPLAVVPFGGLVLGDNNNMGAIIAADLERSGVFRLPINDHLPAQPHSQSDFQLPVWKDSGVDYVVVGETVAAGDGKLRVRFEVLNAANGARLMGQMVSVAPASWRDIAHYISDAIYEQLSGIKGAFATRIAYVTQTGTGKNRHYRLNLADADGARPVMLLDSPKPVMSPSWSPDGKKIAYVSFETGRSTIWVQDIASQRREQIASFEGINSAPAWSPDGSQMALVLSRDGNPEIYLMSLADHSLRRLTSHYGIDTEPRFFPDGKSLVMTSDRSGKPQLYKLDIASGTIRRLTFEGDYNARGDVTADGRTLLMVNRQDGKFRIAAQELASGQLRLLTDTAMDESPSVAPNGSMVVFATRSGGQSVLGVAALEGGSRFRLPAREGKVMEPAWSPYLR